MSITRRAAIDAVVGSLDGDEAAVFANGYVSRDGQAAAPSARNFYMLGSMGLAAAIGLGIALAQPDARVVIFDADGNLLMGFGVLPMAGAWQPRTFLHVVLDNGVYASTGGQPTIAPAIDFVSVAEACGYRRAERTADPDRLGSLARTWIRESGPSLIHVSIDPHEEAIAERVGESPPAIARRFASNLGR